MQYLSQIPINLVLLLPLNLPAGDGLGPGRLDQLIRQLIAPGCAACRAGSAAGCGGQTCRTVRWPNNAATSGEENRFEVLWIIFIC
jgi:hypothetical protein